jgi:hypothetical protein
VPPFPWFIVNLVFGLVVAFIANPLRSTAQVSA